MRSSISLCRELKRREKQREKEARRAANAAAQPQASTNDGTRDGVANEDSLSPNVSHLRRCMRCRLGDGRGTNALRLLFIPRHTHTDD
jgi:hypothetical protein